MTNKAMMTRHWKRITEVREKGHCTHQLLLLKNRLIVKTYCYTVNIVSIDTSVWFCEQVTGHTFEVETDTFKLRNIMEAPLLKYKEEIEVRTVVIYLDKCIVDYK